MSGPASRTRATHHGRLTESDDRIFDFWHSACDLRTKDWGTAIVVGVGILAIEQVMGNFLDPRIQGRTVSLSPLVILIALLLWTWIWGIAGAFLATPMLILFLVVGAHLPALRPFALLISREIDFEELERATGS